MSEDLNYIEDGLNADNATKVESTKNQKSVLMNLPNKLIIVRFILTFIMWIFLFMIPRSIENGNYVNVIGTSISYYLFVALFIFILAAITDFLDGHLARKRNQITEFGKLFDPLADKILVNSVLIFFAVYHYIPIWVTLLFIVRDVLINGLRMLLSTKNKTLTANKYGKLKTLFQVFGLSIVFIIHPEPIPSINMNGEMIGSRYDYGSTLQVGASVLYLALGLSIYSGINYYYDNWKYVKG